MKRSFIFLFLLLLSTSITKCDCSSITKEVVSYHYDNSESYIAASDYHWEKNLITSIDLDWVNGDIVVEKTNQTYFSYSEEFLSSSTDSTNTSYLAHYYLDGTTLKIRYLENGVAYDDYHNISKRITISLPESLSKIKISSVSCTVKMEEVEISNVQLSSVSGDITMKNLLSNNVELNTVSGNITVTQTSTISKIKIDTVSSNCKMYLPDEIGYHCDFSVVSGSYYSSKKESNQYSYFDEAMTIDYNSVSGSFSIVDLVE
jgi:DUF4097 and DUF4098 domain-containing protein YvlB